MQYDEICALINQCVYRTDYDVFANMHKIVVIVINEEKRFLKCMDGIFRINPNLGLILVAQPTMQDFLAQTYHGHYQIVGWKGRYTVDLVSLLKENADVAGVDGFLFFTEQSVNMRDHNFMQIAELMQESADIKVLSNTIGNEMFEYRNVVLFNQAIKTYREMDRLIELIPESWVIKHEKKV